MNATTPTTVHFLSDKQLIDFCQRWDIVELALFGSILRQDFSPTSDIDILITFDPKIKRNLFDLVKIKDELEQLVGRNVDVLTKKSVEQSHNWLRKREILSEAQVVYGS